MAEMITLRDACDQVRMQVSANPAESRSLNELLGCVLAEPIVSQVDAPPYDKSLVDGYAIIAADVAKPGERFRVVEEIMAGHVPHHSIGPGQASRIMTGGVLPQGADAVVMVEQTRCAEGATEWVEIDTATVHPGQNVMRQGAAMTAGRVVLPVGQQIRAIEVGLMAEAGRTVALVVRPPRVALIQTGDELVDASQPLGPGLIRNSNGPMLQAMVRQVGGVTEDLGIVQDQMDLLSAAVRKGLEADVLIVSGGVSQGDRDFVPKILTDAGVERVFHKVQLRPGKPLWFGVLASDGRKRLVFGLPGNPVSGLVCCRLFVQPALRQLAGHSPEWDWRPRGVRLSEPFTLKGNRPTFWPGRLDETREHVEPLKWLGSADPFALAQSDCLISFQDGGRSYSAGESVRIIGWEC